jgi:anti-sigma factor RsiW
MEQTQTARLTCRDVIGMLADYLESALPIETVRAFDEHLDECQECVAYVNTYTKTRELTGHAVEVEMPREMKARLRGLLLEHLARAGPV